MAEISPGRILIVDDDKVFIKALGDTLRDEGYSVVPAIGGQAGIEAFRNALEKNEPFALVISDLGMMDVDGRQVVNAVKADSPSTPVVLMTGWGEWFEGKESLLLPVDQVMSKPPKLAELRQMLAKCIGGK